VTSGHDERAFMSVVDGVAPNRATLVILMGMERSSALATGLIEHGWARTTPCAIVVDASNLRQQVWRGRLEDLAADEPSIETIGAGTIVIGQVAAMELVHRGAADERRELEQSVTPEETHVSRR